MYEIGNIINIILSCIVGSHSLELTASCFRGFEIISLMSFGGGENFQPFIEK